MHVLVCAHENVAVESSFGEQPDFPASRNHLLDSPLSDEVAAKGLRTRTGEAEVRISYCLMPPTEAMSPLLAQTVRSQNKLFPHDSFIYAPGSF
jgi:hypothetical protein